MRREVQQCAKVAAGLAAFSIQFLTSTSMHRLLLTLCCLTAAKGLFGCCMSKENMICDDGEPVFLRIFDIKSLEGRRQHQSQLEILRQLHDQPKIVQLVHVQWDFRRVYIGMEFCKGGSLAEKQLEEAEIWDVLREIVIGFRVLSDFDISLTDLQSKDVLFCKTNEVKITGFQHATIIGTLNPIVLPEPSEFTAPEVFQPNADLTKADLYSLGTILKKIQPEKSSQQMTALISDLTQQDPSDQISLDDLERRLSNTFDEDDDANSFVTANDVQELETNLNPEMYGEALPSAFKVRGATYLTDKVKISAGPSEFQLKGMNLWNLKTKEDGLNIASSALGSFDVFTFVINFIVPGTPYLALSMYFQPKEGGELSSIMEKFLREEKDERDARFKLIPSITGGSWFLRNLVPSTPALICKKLSCFYTKKENYFQLDVDISSDGTAKTIVGLVRSTTSSLVIDMAFVLEGKTNDELPERMLGTVRLSQLDLTSAV